MKNIIVFLLPVVFMISIRSFAQCTSSKKTNFIEKSVLLSNDIRLAYVEQGDADGIPVIFLHGIADSWHSFETTLVHLPFYIHAFAISQRGHGNSERPLQGYTPKDFAEDVAAFIKEEKLGSAFIVGHSMGAVNAQQFALLYPHLLKGLIFIGGDAAFKDNPGMPEFLSEVVKLKDPIDRTFMDDFQQSTLSRPIDPSYYNLLVDEALKVPAPVLKEAFKGFMRADYTNDLNKITAPVLIMWGEKDGLTFRKDQNQLAKGTRNSKFITYEDTGHALHWQEPKKFSEDLVAFISRLHPAK